MAYGGLCISVRSRILLTILDHETRGELSGSVHILRLPSTDSAVIHEASFWQALGHHHLRFGGYSWTYHRL